VLSAEQGSDIRTAGFSRRVARALATGLIEPRSSRSIARVAISTGRSTEANRASERRVRSRRAALE
jgi:hypothetical protein